MGIGFVMETENLSLVTMHRTIGHATAMGKSSVTVTRDYAKLAVKQWADGSETTLILSATNSDVQDSPNQDG
jgi:hypothetical protein